VLRFLGASTASVTVEVDVASDLFLSFGTPRRSTSLGRTSCEASWPPTTSFKASRSPDHLTAAR
jgi:hypothetical protein